MSINLGEFIDKTDVRVFNNAKGTKGVDVLGGAGGIVWSEDGDAQLLFIIPFSEEISIETFSIRADKKPEEKECADSAPPLVVKLYINNPNLNFSDLEDNKPLFEYKLEPEDIIGKPIKVNPRKFFKVKSLAVFIEDNQAESEMTFLNQITLIGRGSTDLVARKSEPFIPLMFEIQPGLWLGNDRMAEEKASLGKMNITHVLGITDAVVDYSSEVTVSLHCMTDKPDTKLYKIFDESRAFITNALKTPGNNVYVHCREMTSCSVALICAYLIVTKTISAKKALKMVQMKVPQANPNYGFWKQLLQLQLELNITE